MRKYKAGTVARQDTEHIDVQILIVDDDKMLAESLQSFFENAGYTVDIETNPETAVERVRTGNYGIMLLDYYMQPINGDQVVERIRDFNRELFIILLTGYRNAVPPIQTVRELDIQGYCEKSGSNDQLWILVESCVKSIKLMRTITSYRDGLSNILEGNPEIYKLQPLQEMLNVVIEQGGKAFGESPRFIYVRRNFDAPEDIKDKIQLKKSLFEATDWMTSLEDRASEWMDRVEAGESAANIISDTGLDFFSPMTDEKGHPIGIFGAVRPEGKAAADFCLYRLFIKQAASAVSNMMLHMEVSLKNRELEDANDRLSDNFYDMVSAIRNMVDARDIYTRGHSDRVAYYAVTIAAALGRDESYQQRIKLAGLFHDVGKISVPDCILLKNDKLTDSEYTEVKNHAESGYNLLSCIKIFKDIAEIVYQHHERIDGRGYPRGLMGDEICEEAKIICIADSFDAMVSDRQYRKGMPVEKALAELRACSGTQFDTEIVNAFAKVVEENEDIDKRLAWTYASSSYASDYEEIKEALNGKLVSAL